MKNIHLVSTDKPSRLVIDTIEHKLYYQPILHNKTVNVLPQNIYITSDEELVLGGYHFNSRYGDEPQKTNQRDINSRKYWEQEDYYITKIILTDNKDLIKDSVQAINDEFLEWFVKNPSCEEVEVEKQMLCDYCGQEHCDNLRCRGYKDSVWYEIIISQEEPKQETIEEVKDLAYWRVNAKEDYIEVPISVLRYITELEERMYSEDEVKHIISEALQSALVTVDLEQWFEQFKKINNK
jgi:hypothetical protein